VNKPLLFSYTVAGVFLASLLAFSYYKIVLDVLPQSDEVRTSLLLETNDSFNFKTNDWINRLKESKKSDFIYPVSEIEIALKEDTPELDKKFYRVVIDELDGYKFFCVNQVLSANNINYSFYKDGGLVKLIIASADYKELRNIMETVKEYGIEYKIEE